MIKKRNKIKILFTSFIIILLLTVPFTTLARTSTDDKNIIINKQVGIPTWGPLCEACYKGLILLEFIEIFFESRDLLPLALSVALITEVLWPIFENFCGWSNYNDCGYLQIETS